MSVVVPSHGRTALLAEMLTSLAEQTTDDFELVVSDDAPVERDRDETRELVQQYGAETQRPWRYVSGGTSLGIARNTNQGLAVAAGEFVRQLHSDDLLAPTCIERELEAMSLLGQNCPALFHHPVVFENGERPQWREASLCLVDARTYVQAVYHSGTPVPSGILVRRSVLAELGGLDEALSFLVDWEFFGRLLLREARVGRAVALFSGGLVGWRTHGASMSAGAWDDFAREHASAVRSFLRASASVPALWRDRAELEEFAVQAARFRWRRLGDDLGGWRTSTVWRHRQRLLPAVTTLDGLAVIPAIVRRAWAAHRAERGAPAQSEPHLPPADLEHGGALLDRQEGVTRPRGRLDVFPFLAFEPDWPGAWLRLCVDYANIELVRALTDAFPALLREVHDVRIWLSGLALDDAVVSALGWAQRAGGTVHLVGARVLNPPARVAELVSRTAADPATARSGDDDRWVWATMGARDDVREVRA